MTTLMPHNDITISKILDDIWSVSQYLFIVLILTLWSFTSLSKNKTTNRWRRHFKLTCALLMTTEISYEAKANWANYLLCWPKRLKWDCLSCYLCYFETRAIFGYQGRTCKCTWTLIVPVIGVSTLIRMCHWLQIFTKLTLCNMMKPEHMRNDWNDLILYLGLRFD